MAENTVEKVSLDWKSSIDFNETVEIMNNGIAITVKTAIPFEEKMEFVDEYAQTVLVFDEKNNTVTCNPMHRVVFDYLLVKHYTNIDMAGVELADFVNYDTKTGLAKTVMEVCSNDANAVRRFVVGYAEETCKSWMAGRSLNTLVANILGGDFTGETLMKALSESRLVNETMLDLIHRQSATETGAPVAGNSDAESAPNLALFSAFAKKDID